MFSILTQTITKIQKVDVFLVFWFQQKERNRDTEVLRHI
jgi:hypothetical protein